MAVWELVAFISENYESLNYDFLDYGDARSEMPFNVKFLSPKIINVEVDSCIRTLNIKMLVDTFYNFLINASNDLNVLRPISVSFLLELSELVSLYEDLHSVLLYVFHELAKYYAFDRFFVQ